MYFVRKCLWKIRLIMIIVCFVKMCTSINPVTVTLFEIVIEVVVVNISD